MSIIDLFMGIVSIIGAFALMAALIVSYVLAHPADKNNREMAKLAKRYGFGD